jgi:hypothetical protein
VRNQHAISSMPATWISTGGEQRVEGGRSTNGSVCWAPHIEKGLTNERYWTCHRTASEAASPHRQRVEAVTITELIVRHAEVQEAAQRGQANCRDEAVVVEGEVTQPPERGQLLSYGLEVADAVMAEIGGTQIARPRLWDIEQLLQVIVCTKAAYSGALVCALIALIPDK